MAINLAGLKMKNPVTVASGTFGFGLEFADLVPLHKLGAITTKTLTIKPRKGNPQPRLMEVENGLVNSIGLQNDGVEYFIANYLPELKKIQTSLIVNIAGETVEEYVATVEILCRQEGINAIEVNISCPNVKKGCIAFGKDPVMTKEVISAVREVCKLPLIAKLTPNVSDITVIARAALDGGADILSMINTVQHTVTIPDKNQLITGGLSGPTIKPTALRLINQVRAAFPGIPIIGMGGIMGIKDAKDFFAAGANAIAVGTANFVDPRIVIGIIDSL
ncbi:MAG: dihydroorotate dehydrogenase [Candidatus Margulisiibacteriota bacterium]